MTETVGEYSVIHERIGIAGKYREHFLVMRVRVGVAAVSDERASTGLLQTYIRWIDLNRAHESRGRFVIAARESCDSRNSRLDCAVVGIDGRGAQKCGKIPLVGSHRELKLVEAAPEK